jgi:hypothetical protein
MDMTLRQKIVTAILIMIGIPTVIFLQAWITKRGTRPFQNSLICIPYSRQTMEADLAQAKQRWNQLGNPKDYAITIGSIRGGGMQSYVQLDARVVFRDDQAVTAVDVRDGYEESAAGYNSNTVAATFDQVESLIQGSNQPPCYSLLEVSYDPTYGYVTQYEADGYGLLNPYTHCFIKFAKQGCSQSPDYRSIDIYGLLIPGDPRFFTPTPTASPVLPTPKWETATPVAYPLGYPLTELPPTTPFPYPP